MSKKKVSVKVDEQKMENESVEESNSIEQELEEEKTLPNETKEAKFIRLAQKRMGKILKSLKSLSKLSNKNNYIYTEEQISLMFEALNASISILETKFSNTKTEKPSFSF
jgi:hypothetical protein